MIRSLHGELAPSASEDLVGDDDFLGASPPVLVPPHVAPPHKVRHRYHRTCKPPHERLPPHYGEEHECQRRGQESILKAAELVLGNPVLILEQILLRLRRNVRLMYQEVHEFTLFLIARCQLLSALLVVSF